MRTDGGSRTEIQVQSHSPLIEAMRKLSNAGPQGATWKLADITSFAWDRVHYFPEGARMEDIRSATHSTLFGDRTGRLMDRGPLLVFVHDGRVVQALLVLPPLHLSSHGSVFRSDGATLRAHSKPPAPHLLVLE